MNSTLTLFHSLTGLISSFFARAISDISISYHTSNNPQKIIYIQIPKCFNDMEVHVMFWCSYVLLMSFKDPHFLQIILPVGLGL